MVDLKQELGFDPTKIVPAFLRTLRVRAKDIGVRAAKTAGQVFLTAVAADTFDVASFDAWKSAVAAAAVAGVTVVWNSVLAFREVRVVRKAARELQALAPAA